MRSPTARQWLRHGALFLITGITATIAGVMLAADQTFEPSLSTPETWTGYFSYVPQYYFSATSLLIYQALHDPHLLASGLTFAGALLAILLAHEAGHYVACRYYGVDATLPFFIPAPPLFLAGTFGAFIKIRSPVPTKRALFDIAVAGPIAGFIVVIPIAVLALVTSQPGSSLSIADGQSVIVFNDPMLLRVLAPLFAVDLPNIAGNSYYFAAWIGLLVTSLNLMPVSQLDGGHATYAVFGARTHKMLGRAAFASISVLAVLGWMWHGSPSGFLFAVLLGVMLRIRHPQALDETDNLGSGRSIVAWLTLVVFVLSFWPFPITIR